MHIRIIPSRKVIIFFVTLGRHMPLMVQLMRGSEYNNNIEATELLNHFDFITGIKE